MFHRSIESKLERYYQNPSSPIMLITGARQIGKSFIIRETASKAFANYIEINMQEDFENQKIFLSVSSKEDFYFAVSSLYGKKLGDIENTIIFIDEIQVYPHLLSLLKPLKADGKFRYIASGSLLGIALKHQFIPIGSLIETKMYPMDFKEFLLASGSDASVIDYLSDCFKNKKQVSEAVHKIMLRRFKEYLLCGGLPDSVKEFLNGNIEMMREIQNQIYSFYKDDAAKYENERKLKIRAIYDSLPSYMDNKVKRVLYSKVENKANASYEKYAEEFDYLLESGISLGVKAVSNPVYPLIDSSSKNLIKLYYNDVGILTSVLFKNNVNAVLAGDKSVNLGSVYETACAEELVSHGHTLFYFDSKKVGEVDFLLNDYDSLSVLPIEIKSGNDQNNFRAIPKLLKEPYSLKKGYVFGNDAKLRSDGKLSFYPIYMIMCM